MDYTSLVGGQKKKLLDKLPAKFHEFLYPDTCATVCKLWTSFSDYYHLITDFKIGPEAADEIFEKGKAWVELFCSLRGTRPGYLKARVTPYMHMMVYDVPFFVQRYGCFKKFSGQGVEKNNDDAKRMLFHKSNKWDGAKDILCVESRQWELRDCEREKGIYIKRKLEYWEEDISKIRKERRLLSEVSNSQITTSQVTNSGEENPDDNINYGNYTVKKLMAIVKEKGLYKRGVSKLKKDQLIALLEES